MHTSDQIKFAAKLMKIVRLAGMPGMDVIAVKLNCDPDYREIEEAKKWAKAFALSTTGRSAFELARELAKD